MAAILGVKPRAILSKSVRVKRKFQGFPEPEKLVLPRKARGRPRAGMKYRVNPVTANPILQLYMLYSTCVCGVFTSLSDGRPKRAVDAAARWKDVYEMMKSKFPLIHLSPVHIRSSFTNRSRHKSFWFYLYMAFCLFGVD